MTWQLFGRWSLQKGILFLFFTGSNLSFLACVRLCTFLCLYLFLHTVVVYFGCSCICSHLWGSHEKERERKCALFYINLVCKRMEAKSLKWLLYSTSLLSQRVPFKSLAFRFFLGGGQRYILYIVYIFGFIEDFAVLKGNIFLNQFFFLFSCLVVVIRV